MNLIASWTSKKQISIGLIAEVVEIAIILQKKEKEKET